MEGLHPIRCLAPHFLRRSLTSAIPVHTPETRVRASNCTDVVQLTVIDMQCRPYSLNRHLFCACVWQFLLLLKVNKLYQYLFYLINSHISIQWMMEKFFSSCFVSSGPIIVPPKLCTFPPKSSPPRAEDGVIISHLILQIAPLSQPVEMASREGWLQNLNNLTQRKRIESD